jgi:demethylmenaquinone methyltransferase/2-methoxy-6-polyprenyl-1,4-benzoquinol methylase
MSTLVYMKLLEQTPAKYDRGMQVVSLGRIGKIKQEIASAWIEPGHRVLEIGCGAGSLAALMTGRGAHVTGIDTSETMLAVARKTAPAAELHHLTAIDIDRFDEGSFDRIVTTLVLSELSEDEIGCVLRASLRLLKPEGKLIVADEVRPAAWWQRLVSYLVRWPLAALTFLLTQNTTHALRGLEARLEKAGYRIVSRKQYLMGTLALIVVEKA